MQLVRSVVGETLSENLWGKKLCPKISGEKNYCQNGPSRNGHLVGQLSREQLVLHELVGVLQHDGQHQPHQRVVWISAFLHVVENPLQKHLPVEESLREKETKNFRKFFFFYICLIRIPTITCSGTKAAQKYSEPASGANPTMASYDRVATFF
jgi:hypothetical protein